jgi:hypothetical protein
MGEYAMAGGHYHSRRRGQKQIGRLALAAARLIAEGLA